MPDPVTTPELGNDAAKTKFQPWTEETRDAIATAMEAHHIQADVTDGMGNNPCSCGQWWDASEMEGWDQHMADVALAALTDNGALQRVGGHADEPVHVVASFDNGPQPTPRVWTMPEIPDNVQAFSDRFGGVWTRVHDWPDRWVSTPAQPEQFTDELLRLRGPLTEVVSNVD